MMRFVHRNCASNIPKNARPQYSGRRRVRLLYRVTNHRQFERVYTDYIPYILDRHKATDINEPEDLAMAEVLYLGLQALSRDGQDT